MGMKYAILLKLILLKKTYKFNKVIKNNKVQKIFHYARFDVAVFKYNFKINIKNIYCTKIASKLVRTYTDKHGYKDLCSELLDRNISKIEQSSDWGGEINKRSTKICSNRCVVSTSNKKQIRCNAYKRIEINLQKHVLTSYNIEQI